MAENRHFLGARFVVSGRKIAAENRCYANNFEEVFRYITARVTLRVVFVADVDGRSAEVRGGLAERLLGRAQIFIILRGGDIAYPEIVILRRRQRID